MATKELVSNKQICLEGMEGAELTNAIKDTEADLKQCLAKLATGLYPDNFSVSFESKNRPFNNKGVEWMSILVKATLEV